jgi:hypothetical protein
LLTGYIHRKRSNKCVCLANRVVYDNHRHNSRIFSMTDARVTFSSSVPFIVLSPCLVCPIHCPVSMHALQFNDIAMKSVLKTTVVDVLGILSLRLASLRMSLTPLCQECTVLTSLCQECIVPTALCQECIVLPRQQCDIVHVLEEKRQLDNRGVTARDSLILLNGIWTFLDPRRLAEVRQRVFLSAEIGTMMLSRRHQSTMRCPTHSVCNNGIIVPTFTTRSTCREMPPPVKWVRDSANYIEFSSVSNVVSVQQVCSLLSGFFSQGLSSGGTSTALQFPTISRVETTMNVILPLNEIRLEIKFEICKFPDFT